MSMESNGNLNQRNELDLFSPDSAPRALAPVDFSDGAGGDEEGGIDLSGVRRQLFVIWRRRALVFSLAAVGLIGGIILAMIRVPLYTATASVEVQSLNGNFLNMRDLEPLGSGTPGVDVPTEVAILSSNFLLKRVTEKMRADKQPPFTSPLHPIWEWLAKQGVPVPRVEVTTWGDSIKKAVKTLEVTSVAGSRVITISSDSQNPEAAGRLVNMLAESFIEEHRESRWTSAKKTNEWLSRQLDDLRTKLQESEQRLQDYSDATGLKFLSGEDKTAAAQKLRQLQDELFRAQAARMGQETKNELLKSGTPESILEVIDDSTLRSYQLKLSDLKQQLADLNTAFTPSHYSVRRLQAQISEVEQGYERVRATLMKRLMNDYDTARKQEANLAAAYAKQQQLVAEEDQKAIRYNLLKREVDTNRQLYESILAKMKEAGVAATMLASNVRVVDSAEQPLYPDIANPVMFGGVGMGLGVLLSVLIILGFWNLDSSVKLPGDSESMLQLPELGVIPAASSDPFQRRQLALARNGALKLDAPGEGGEVVKTVELVTVQQSPSMLAESFRSTLASLLFSAGGAGAPRVVAVTSASPLEGKSTVVSNLGLALAETRRRVLLIDTDMRKPRLHKIFNVPNERGLRQILEGEEGLDQESVSQLIVPTGVPGLWLLPSGPPLQPTATLLYSTRMAELLQKCRGRFDWVLIDTPPAIPVVDARLVGRLVDGVVLVVRSGKTHREMARTVRKRLAADGTRVLGAVLNDWNPEMVQANYYADHLRHYDMA